MLVEEKYVRTQMKVSHILKTDSFQFKLHLSEITRGHLTFPGTNRRLISAVVVTLRVL